MIEVEVMCQDYTGKLQLEPENNSYSLFSVYLEGKFIGHIQPIRLKENIHWYSHQIKNKELLAQVGEWAEFHYTITDKSFQKIYSFNLIPKFLRGLFSFFKGNSPSKVYKNKTDISTPSTEKQQKALK